MFLTTNLLEGIDEAFRSRIHIHVCYPALSNPSRLLIWKRFLLRLRVVTHSSPKSSNNDEEETPPQAGLVGPADLDLSSSDLESLATWELNGREIKNVVRMAHLWCMYNGYTLNLERLETSIEMTSPMATKPQIRDISTAVSGKHPRLRI